MKNNIFYAIISLLFSAMHVCSCGPETVIIEADPDIADYILRS